MTQNRTAAATLLGVLTLFRLWYGATQTGMVEDETYYWQWSRHLALSFYDQGPGIALLIRAGTTLFGDTPLGVRIGPILLGAGTGWLTYLTARRWWNPTVALWTLILLSAAPLLSVGSILATYDGPQVFFWAASLYALTWTIQDERRGGWYLVGLLVGLGALCKLTMLLFAPCVLFFLAASPRYRRHLATPHPYLAFVIALALFSPVLIWNADHGWMNFLHSATLGNRTRDAKPLRWFWDFLGGQAGLALSPLLFIAEIAGLVLLARRRNSDAATFTVAFGAPVLLLCVFMSLRSKLEINWPVPAHLAGLIAAAVWVEALWESGRIGKRVFVASGVALGAVVTLAALFPAVLAPLNLKAKTASKLNQPYGWPQIADAIQDARVELEKEGRPVFVAGTNYRVNSVMAFYLPDRPETQGMYLNSRRDQYYLWTDPKKLVGQNAVLVLDDDFPDVPELARRYFDSVEALPPFSVTRPGFRGPVKTWYRYRCRNFKGYDPDAHAAGY